MKCWGKIKSFFKRPKAKAKAAEKEAAEVSEEKADKASEKKA
ncbi:MAG TPA: hypothetical protein VMW64_03000 [Dehalococcoidia bacterium]|nr:hypothetical protein [Dehalococcoidia bacterium]